MSAPEREHIITCGDCGHEFLRSEDWYSQWKEHQKTCKPKSKPKKESLSISAAETVKTEDRPV